MAKTTKSERLVHANQLISIIASYGRRFFWSDVTQKTAHMELRRGRVYFVDDYSGKAIYTHNTGYTSRWRGFTHGGTLRRLVELMRDYIQHGTPIPPHMIAIPQLGETAPEKNIWGYDGPSVIAMREQAFALPIIQKV